MADDTKTPLLTKPLAHIRNFAIIAHIDHGKSTLADRLIQTCGGLEEREMSEQVLDNTDIERERGITIKAQTVRLEYKAKDGITYQLNLMDTPGHVDFSYEVSRSLASCEGSLLVVDASQGVEAQTLANVYQALDNDHEIVPVINKIDLPAADPEAVKKEVEDVIGLDCSEAVEASAKTGQGIEELLESIITTLPPPHAGDGEKPTQALLVDSWYDIYLGVVVLVRVMDGYLRKGQKIKFMSNGATRDIDRVGMFTPKNPVMSNLKALSHLFRWFFVPSTQLTRVSLKSYAIVWVKFASMTQAFITRWKVAKRLALVSVVGFLGCFIWRLFKSVWSVNLIST